MTENTDKVPKRGNPNLKGGSRTGKPNKNTAAIKDMILTALSMAGGAEYLLACAQNEKTTAAFLGLVGKVLPLQVTGADGGAVLADLTVRFVGSD